jgi:hypothetical protein
MASPVRKSSGYIFIADGIVYPLMPISYMYDTNYALWIIQDISEMYDANGFCEQNQVRKPSMCE